MNYEAWYNIEDQINPNLINYNNLTQIEKAVIDDDYELVNVLLKKGETNYKENILCNGYYKKKYNLHPPKCHKFVCFKTLIYYGLWKYLYYRSKIFSSIIDLLDDEHCSLNNIAENIREIYYLILSTNCCNETSEYSEFYDHNFGNYLLVNDCLSKNMDKILSHLERNCSCDYLNCENFGKQGFFKIECCKVKKIYDFNRKNENDTELKNSKISFIAGELKYYWEGYNKNNELLKLLFSQQAYEYFENTIKYKQFQLEDSLDKILLNPLIDINYVYNEKNIYSLVTTQQIKNEMILKLSGCGAKFPDSITIDKVISDCNINIVKEIIRTSEINFLGNLENLLSIIFLSNKMMSNDKIEIFEILMERGLLDNVKNLIQICLCDNRSLGLLEKIKEKKHLITKTSPSDILSCIRLLKHKELDILFETNVELVNEKYEGYFPIIYFFEKTKNDGIEEILTLKVMLKHKCNLSVTNSMGDNPLLLSVKNMRNDSCNLLLKSNADPFFYDVDGFNCFHRAIMSNNLTQIKYLIKSRQNNNPIINALTRETKIHPIILALNSDNKVFITQTILSEDELDCNYLYEENNILHYLVKLNIDIKTKNILFKNCVIKNFNLLEQCKTDMKPLVVKAVEGDLYEIVIMIMNKLLELGEIKFEGYDDLKNIDKIIYDPVQRNIIVKEQGLPNFYSLVLYYLKNTKFDEEYTIDLDSFNENMLFSFVITFVYMYIEISINKS